MKSQTPSVCSPDDPAWTIKKRPNAGPVGAWRAENAHCLLIVKFASEPTMLPIQVDST